MWFGVWLSGSTLAQRASGPELDPQHCKNTKLIKIKWQKCLSDNNPDWRTFVQQGESSSLKNGQTAQISIKPHHGSLNPIGEKIRSLLNVYVLC